MNEYSQLLADRTNGWYCGMAMTIAMFPAAMVNGFAALYCVLAKRNAKSTLYDITRSRHATWVSRLLDRLLG